METSDLKENTRCGRIDGILSDLNKTRRFVELYNGSKLQTYETRNSYYEERGVTSMTPKKEGAPEENMDFFDKTARVFRLEKIGDPNTYLLLRAINRKLAGLIPSELSLYSIEELIELSEKKGLGFNKDKLFNSTISEESKEKFKGLLSRFQNSSRVYELGGLCGKDNSRLGTMELIYSISRFGCDDDWDLEIQTCHPKHVPIYLAAGLPYKSINPRGNSKKEFEPYLDYLGRPAVTMYLIIKELREALPNLEKRAMTTVNN